MSGRLTAVQFSPGPGNFFWTPNWTSRFSPPSSWTWTWTCRFRSSRFRSIQTWVHRVHNRVLAANNMYQVLDNKKNISTHSLTHYHCQNQSSTQFPSMPLLLHSIGHLDMQLLTAEVLQTCIHPSVSWITISSTRHRKRTLWQAVWCRDANIVSGEMGRAVLNGRTSQCSGVMWWYQPRKTYVHASLDIMLTKLYRDPLLHVCPTKKERRPRRSKLYPQLGGDHPKDLRATESWMRWGSRSQSNFASPDFGTW